jgi:site-specific recombinase XerD
MAFSALVSKTPQVKLNVVELQQCSQEWILSCELQNRSHSTIDIRRRFMEKFFWFLNQRGFEECGTPELRLFFHYLRTGHEDPGGRWNNPYLTKPLRPISVKDYYNCLRIFFEWMIREEIIDVSPMARIERIMVREEIKQPLSPEQVAALLQAARNSSSPRRNEAIVLMLLDCGLRASELVSLRVGDVDLKNGSFQVIGKGNKKRMGYCGKVAMKSLMGYLRSTKLPPDAPLFPKERANLEPLTTSGLLCLIKKLAKAAGISANPHQLRRTFATAMLHAGADICSVRDLLGHTNIQMTLKYLSVAQSHIETQHRKFSPGDRLNMK